MHVRIMSGIALSLAAVALSPALADLTPVAPKEGETVEQLWPDVKAFLDLPREARQHNGERISEKEKKLFHKHIGAKPVEFRWTGDAAGVYTLKVLRAPDGKVFVERTVTGLVAQVSGRLEVGRDWT